MSVYLSTGHITFDHLVQVVCVPGFSIMFFFL